MTSDIIVGGHHWDDDLATVAVELWDRPHTSHQTTVATVGLRDRPHASHQTAVAMGRA